MVGIACFHSGGFGGSSSGPDHDIALTFPFVMFAIFRYHLLVETQSLGEKAEELVLVDRPMQVCILGFAVVAVAALHLAS